MISFISTIVLAITVLHTAPVQGATSSSAPTNLTTEGLHNPADVDSASAPSFGWEVATDRQSAYRIVVATSAKKAARLDGDIWDSGQVSSSDQNEIAYDGPDLQDDTQYHWAVATWDGDGKRSRTSSVNRFHTAPQGDWAADSIWAQQTDSASPAEWTDYSVSAEISIDATALGLFLRAEDEENGLMWQFRADANQLVPHLVRDGSYTALDPVDLPDGALQVNTPADVSIRVTGQEVETSIADQVVDSRTVDGYEHGSVGVRTGSSESGTVDDLRVVDADGEVLVGSEASDPPHLPCAQSAGSGWEIGKSQSCVFTATDSKDWSFLRGEFTPDRGKRIDSAVLFATGGDFDDHLQYSFKAYVNGDFAGLGPTCAMGQESRFDGFDITDSVKAGRDNAIGALAYTAEAEHQRFQAQVSVTYTDGSTDTFGSDTSWKALPGGSVFPEAGSIGTSYFDAPAEDTDMRDYPSDFSAPDFDDSEWKPAVSVPGFDRLEPTPTGKVREEVKSPVKVIDRGDGDYVIDFGRTWVGGTRMQIADGTAGDQVTLRYGEVLNDDGSVKYRLNTGNTYEDSPTLRDGEQTVETFGIRVFRYMEVQNAPEPITADNLEALALVYPFDESASSFQSSDDNLNQVYDLSKNTIEATNLNLYTDSWTRERAPYEADAYLQQKSSLYLMKDLSLADYTFDFFKDNRTWPTEWPLFAILAAHDSWTQTGSEESIRDKYESLAAKLPEKWIDEQTGLVTKAEGSNGCNSRTDCDIVDWPTSQRDGYVFAETNTVLNALSYKSYTSMAEMAEAIGNDDDAEHYRDRASALREGMNTLLLDTDAGAYDDGLRADGTVTGHTSLHASAFALSFGVPADEDRKAIADFVADKKMVCSVYCAGISLDGLFASGRADAAVDQLTDEGTSSWMNMIELGAGATSEAWDPSQKSNLTYSHPWAASPAFHVPAGLFGIEPIEPGYDRFSVAPEPGGVQSARLSVPTVKGTVGAAFDHDDSGRMRVAASVPGNSEADISIRLSSAAAAKVHRGQAHVYLDSRRVRADVEDGVATVADVSAGCHVLTEVRDRHTHRKGSIKQVCQSGK